LVEFDAYQEPRLETPRLLLEPINAWHGEPMFAGMKDPLLYTYTADEPPLSVSALSRHYEKLESRKAPDGGQLWLNWAVLERTGGYAGLMQATVRRDATALVAWRIFTNFQRKGIAAEAAAVMVAHLAHIGCHVAIAYIDVRNTASIRLAESLGFVRVATHEKTEKLRGRWIDDHEFRLTLNAGRRVHAAKCGVECRLGAADFPGRSRRT